LIGQVPGGGGWGGTNGSTSSNFVGGAGAKGLVMIRYALAIV
jgi:hypothetical protein